MSLCRLPEVAPGLSGAPFLAPFAYDASRLAGHLAWLAWNALRPGGVSPLQTRLLAIDPPRRLFGLGLLTRLLNPKNAMLYLSLFPQFVDRGVMGSLSGFFALRLALDTRRS